MFDRATKVANWTLSFLLSAVCFMFLKLLWQTVGIKLDSLAYYGFLMAIILFVWYGSKKFTYKNLVKALQEIDHNNFTSTQIKKWGYIGVAFMILSPTLPFVVGIFTISNYNR